MKLHYFVRNFFSIANFKFDLFILMLGVKFGFLAFLINTSIGYFIKKIIGNNEISEINTSSVFIFAFVIFIAPFFEEFFFRGYLQHKFIQRTNSLFKGIIITNMIWCIIHILDDIRTPIILFVPGLVFGWVQYKTESVWAPIISHIVMNLLVVVSMIFFIS